MGAGPTWTDEEKQLVIDNPDMPPDVLAEKLGRTECAIRNFRHRLRGKGEGGKRNYLGQSFDERPSGWYGESVGQLLIDYEPAWSAWKHYHRYVEIVEVSRRESVLGGLVHLMCRRDADAL